MPAADRGRRPVLGPERGLHLSRPSWIAEFRRDGYGVISVWVEVDRAPSKDAPDGEPFGVVTAYCKIPAKANAENRCPEWVNDTL